VYAAEWNNCHEGVREGNVLEEEVVGVRGLLIGAVSGLVQAPLSSDIAIPCHRVLQCEWRFVTSHLSAASHGFDSQCSLTVYVTEM
jgi:hypothetical protein